MYPQQKYEKYKLKITTGETLGGVSDNSTREPIIAELDENDNKLIEELKRFAIIHCDENYHQLATGMMHESKKIIYSLASKSPGGYAVHGEHAIISCAKLYDNYKRYISLVSVSKSGKIKAPCGICRELLKHHYPNLYIIVPDGEKLIKIKAKYLLPFPYVMSEMTEESKLDSSVKYSII
jgi:cytidine deaminase